jgi:probable rRNA maturation factor
MTRLRVAVTDGHGRPVRLAAARGLASWLAGAAPRRARGTVAVALVTDAEMRRLNTRHRRVRSATDVLSFGTLDDGGNLAIALGVAARQAREFGHSLRAELRILALHGLLHLLGYDHETDRGAMAGIEERLRRRAGLPTGLIVRGRKTNRSRR